MSEDSDQFRENAYAVPLKLHFLRLLKYYHVHKIKIIKHIQKTRKKIEQHKWSFDSTESHTVKGQTLVNKQALTQIYRIMLYHVTLSECSRVLNYSAHLTSYLVSRHIYNKDNIISGKIFQRQSYDLSHLLSFVQIASNNYFVSITQ